MDLKYMKLHFDVRSYLSDIGVRWSGEGDNVGEGWIGIRCIYCADKLNHLGINLSKKYFKCWKCNATGDIIRLIRDLENIGFEQARRRLKDYSSVLYDPEPKQVSISRRKRAKLPPFAKRIKSGREPAAVKAFLRRRGFPVSVCERYRLMYCDKGIWRLRLIVPIFVQGQMVSYQGVDVTGRASLRYKNCPKDWAVTQNRHLVYGIDDVENQCVLVEGITDKWRVGNGAVALLGKNYTKQQILFLQKHLDRDVVIKVFMDSDVLREDVHRSALSRRLKHYFRTVFNIRLAAGDPADCSRENIEKILSAQVTGIRTIV